MKTFFQLLVVAVIGYFLWVYGIPWVRREVGQSGPPVSNPARGAGGTCVQMAARASEELHDQMLDGERGLMDDATWASIADEVDSLMEQARSTCSCKLESCVLARTALATLASIHSSARGSLVRSSQSVPLELGRGYEQANQQLWDAYNLAQEGR